MTMLQSRRWAILQAIAQAIETQLPALGNPTVAMRVNPRRSMDAMRWIAVEWGDDTHLEKPNNQPKRQIRFTVTVVSRIEGADADCDAIHYAITTHINQLRTQLNKDHKVQQLTPTLSTPDVALLEIDGATIKTVWAVDYFDN